MKAMIFAAGLGTRLKPLTDTLPKALVPVCGVPLIEHVCHRLKAAGIDEAVVNVHHFADKVEEWASAQAWVCRTPEEKSEGRMLVQFSDERARLLETGGAVLHARPYLEGCGSFLVHNVDILSNLDIPHFASKVRPDAFATLLVSERDSSRRLLFHPGTMTLVGWHNLKTGEVRSPFGDLDPEKCVSMAFSGIHIMSENILGVLEDYARSHGLCLAGTPPKFPIIDFYLWACARYEIYGVSADGLELIDVGKHDTLSEAEEFFNRNKL